MGKFVDLTGQRFGRLTVLARVPPELLNKVVFEAHWLCGCRCGELIHTRASSLKNGHTRSCGCFHRDRLKLGMGSPEQMRELGLATRTHGHTVGGPSPEYSSWVAMMQRCYNPNKINYKNYGGRGIKVCIRWHNFENFLADMGERPAGKSLDRINNDGSYTPENTRWATSTEQGNNKRNNRRKKI